MGHVQPKVTKKDSSLEAIAQWRFEELLALGLAPDEAMPLMEVPDVVHAARKLLERGCPLELIARLLEE